MRDGDLTGNSTLDKISAGGDEHAFRWREGSNARLCVVHAADEDMARSIPRNRSTEGTTMNRIAVTIVGLGLSLASVSLGSAEEPSSGQARASAEIRKLGSKVIVDEESPGKAVIGVDFTGTMVSARELAFLRSQGLRDLSHYCYRDSRAMERAFKITDVDLEYLQGLPELQFLNLCGTRVTNARLANLKGLGRLQWLNVSRTRVTAAGMCTSEVWRDWKCWSCRKPACRAQGAAHLKGLTKLQFLDLNQTALSDAGLEHLQGKLGQALPKCEIDW